MASPMRNVFMFSGQGSQYYQMGRALYEQGGTFARSMRAMDRIVQDLGCPSVVNALYGDQPKGAPFDDLVLSHPAIFMVEFALSQTLLEMGIEPHLTLGVSLGSVAASVLAGGLRMEEA
jgi:acyl transferase domain-containing protein